MTCNTYTIQGFTGINDKLKEYAISIGWTEQIVDPAFVFDINHPEVAATMVNNPICHIQHIFSDIPMQNFWAWLEKNKYNEKLSTALTDSISEVKVLKNQVTITEVKE